MSESEVVAPTPTSTSDEAQPLATVSTSLGMRKNGKQWKPTKTAFRPKAGVSKSWDIKMKEKAALQAMKAKEKELKDEKEAEKQERIQAKKAKEEAKAEKARYEKLAEKMHKKRVERLKRREKRNKALKER